MSRNLSDVMLSSIEYDICAFGTAKPHTSNIALFSTSSLSSPLHRSLLHFIALFPASSLSSPLHRSLPHFLALFSAFSLSSPLSRSLFLLLYPFSLTLTPLLSLDLFLSVLSISLICSPRFVTPIICIDDFQNLINARPCHQTSS